MQKILLFIIIILTATSSYARQGAKIAVIIGDNIVSNIDVEDRLKLTLSSSGIDPQKSDRGKFIPQVIQILIDETLYRQEAEKQHIKITDSDIKLSLYNLEKANNVKAGGFKKFIAKRGIDWNVFIDQLTAQMLWNKIIARKIRPQITVTNREIDEKIEDISNSIGSSEYNISEIVIPFEKDKRGAEKRVKALARKLYDKIDEGADFGAVAKEFSRNVSASKGGDIGWIKQRVLPKKITMQIRDLNIGEISRPIKMGEEYHIIKFNGKRALINVTPEDSEVGFKHAFVPTTNTGAALDAEKRQLEQKSKSIKNCKSFDVFAREVYSEIPPKLMMAQIKTLNDDIKNMLSSTKVGTVTPVINSDEGLHVFFVCEKTEATPVLAEKEKIYNMIKRRKIELQARKYLRNLRKNAVIDIRM